MKFYNFTTKKVYESDGTFIVSIKETPLRSDVSAQEYEDQKFYSYDEAIEYINDVLCPKILGDEGFGEGDYDKVEDELSVKVTVPKFKEWLFTINGDNMLEFLEARANGKKLDESSSDEAESKDDSDKEEKETEENSEACSESNESVASKFSKYRKMFEASEEDSSDEDKKSEDGSEEGSEEGGDSASDETSSEEGEDKDKEGDKESDDEEAEMTAIVLTVAKGDGEKLKKEMLDSEDYDFDEDNIEVIEADEDSDEDKVKVDASEAFELKKFLKDKKDIDLEEEIGGEIVDDSEEGDEGAGDDQDTDIPSDEDGEAAGSGEGEDEFNFDDLGDIFGADEEE